MNESRGVRFAVVMFAAQWLLGSAVAETPAYDSSGDEAGADTVQEVIVSAQKREQRLLDVPVPVSVVTADALVKEDLVQFSQFYSRIPGLQYSGSSTSNLSIRGITAGGLTNPTVSILIDDVQFGSSTWQGRPPIPDFDPATLERIEVLRGPQGTLYGASSLGGLIKYVTRQPDMSQLSGRLEVAGDTVKDGITGWSTRGSLNAPLIDQRVALSLSGYYRDDPRYITNIFPTDAGKNVNDVETWGGRAGLLLKPLDNLTVTLSALQQQQNTKFNTTLLVCPECVTAPTTTQANFTPRFGDNTINVAPTFGFSKFESYTAHARLTLDVAELTSISAWNGSRSSSVQDVSNAAFGPYVLGAVSPNGAVLLDDANRTGKFSQELRLAGSVTGFDWLMGGFYTKEHSQIDQALSVVSASAVSQGDVFSNSGPYTFQEEAVFTDLTYHATDKLDVQIGGRYSHNRQVYDLGAVTDSRVAFLFGPSRTLPQRTTAESPFTWLFTPSYHLNADLLGYARVATGYRPGGPNSGALATVANFSSDKVINYELGFKGYVTRDHGVSIDLSVFQIDWKDPQLQSTAIPSGIVFYANGSKARSRGTELATQWTPWKGLTLDANATFTDAILTAPIGTVAGAATLVGNPGDRLPGSARFTTNVSGQQEFALSNKVTAYVGVTYTYLGDRLGSFLSTAGTEPRVIIPGYSEVDFRAGLELGRSWEVGLYARNAFNARGVITADNTNGTVSPFATFIQPATFGLTVARSF